MPVETEVKIEVLGLDDITGKLCMLGAERVSKVREKNIVYDNKGGDFRREDFLLRLRLEVDVESGVEHARLTFKGKKINGHVKKRPEFEVVVSDFSRTNKMLEALGFFKARSYEKIRETWHFGDSEVVLDELPFGNFIEIEGAEDEIKRIAKMLGFSEKEFITDTYFKVAERKGVNGDIVFQG